MRKPKNPTLSAGDIGTPLDSPEGRKEGTKDGRTNGRGTEEAGRAAAGEEIGEGNNRNHASRDFATVHPPASAAATLNADASACAALKRPPPPPLSLLLTSHETAHPVNRKRDRFALYVSAMFLV